MLPPFTHRESAATGVRPPSVIYLVGTSGIPNYGDEFIAATWLRHYARTAPNSEVWLDCAVAGSSTVLLAGLHPNLRVVDTFHQVAWASASQEWDPTELGRRVVTEPGLLPRHATALESLFRVDVVHFIGGGFFNDIWPHHVAMLATAVEMRARFGTRLVMTGAGLMPPPYRDGEVLAGLLRPFDLVDVRDAESQDLLGRHGVLASLTGDDALLGLGDWVWNRHWDRRTRVLVTIQADLLEVALGQIVDYVVASVREWGLTEAPITLVECIPPDDAAALPMLREALPQTELLPFSALWRDGFPAPPSGVWLSTRFHPHLLGSASGLWGVAVPTGSAYYRTKHRSLTAMGSGWEAPESLAEIIPRRTLDDSPPGVLCQRRPKAECAQMVTELTTSPRH